MSLTDGDARALERCVAAGEVAVFPADTVYGLACDPESPAALGRLYELKGRPERKPAAVLFGSLQAATPLLRELPPRTAAVAATLLPGPVTLLLPNPHRRYPLACDPAGEQPQAPLGLRVPAWPARLAALSGLRRPLLQSSANLSGEPPALSVASIPAALRGRAGLVLDGGELPGTASTVIDLARFEPEGEWRIVRAGALEEAAVERAIEGRRA